MSNIHIQEHCSADWNQMAKNEQGRHCEQCALTVHDASDLTEAQILTRYKEHYGQLCIRIPEHRLSATPKVKIGWQNLLLATIVGCWMMLKTSLGKAPELVGHTENLPPHGSDSIAKMKLKCQILDSAEHKQPLIGAYISIFINGKTQTQGMSDFQGFFSLDLQDISKEDTLEIEVSYLGYKTLRDALKIQSALTTSIYLSEGHVCLNEAVVVRNRDEIIMGRMRQGIMIWDEGKQRAVYKMDEYDTKTYHSDDLNRLNLR
jgi:hypothetical protein